MFAASFPLYFSTSADSEKILNPLVFLALPEGGAL